MEITDLEIYNTLYQIGATTRYTGFFYTVYAVRLCIKQPDQLMLVTKCLYPDVAKHYNTTWYDVERNIRTLISAVWPSHSEDLEKIASAPLRKKPCVSEFLSILVRHLMHIQEQRSKSAAEEEQEQQMQE